MMRVAVTGAGGFVGGHVVRALVARGDDVRSFGRRGPASLPRSLPSYTAWDLERGPIVSAQVDAVVHCAAMVGDWGRPSRYRAVNVDGTRHVLDSFATARRIVHISTTSVYSDDVGPGPIRENASTGACRWSTYGRTKAEAEWMVIRLRPDAVVLRPHIVYGPGDTTLLPRVLASRRFGRLAIPGTGRNRLSVTHVENLVLAVLRAIDDPEAHGAFNIADAEVPTADLMLRTTLARLGERADILYIPRALAWAAASTGEAIWPVGDGVRGPPLTRFVVKNLADDHVLDTTRARTVLGYEPRWCFRDGPLTTA